MKLTALRIDRFGLWRDLALNDLAPGINVFFGRNETGKTTLLDFARGILFGFSPHRAKRYEGAAQAGEVWCGSVRWVDETSAWRLERAGHEARAVLERGDGVLQPAPREQWESALGSIDAETFERVFAVGLREMQELGTLGDSQAGALLYELSCGAAGRAVARALADVRQTRASLWDGPGAASQIPQLRAQRRRLRAALAQSRGEIAQFDKRDRSLAALDERIAHGERDLLALRTEARQWEAAHGLRATWAALQSLPHDADDPAGVSASALVRFDELSRRGSRCRKALRAATEQWRKHRAARTALAAAPMRSPDAVQRAGVLLEQRETLLWAERQRTLLREEAQTLRASAPAPVQAAAAAPHPVLPPEKVRRVRIAGRQLAEARLADEAARREAASARRQHASAAEELQRQLQGRNSADVVRAIEHAGQNVNHAKRRLQLDERLTRMERQRGELEEQTRELLDRQVLGYWTLGWLGGLFIFGVALILSGMFLPRSVTGAAGWWLAGLGVGGVGVAVAARHLMEQSAENQLEACRAQINLLNRQTEQSRKERDALDAQLPSDGGPLTRRVDQAEEELERYENLLPMEGRVRAAEQLAVAAEEKAEQARRDLESASAAWREALRLAGLAQDLAPADARALLRTMEQPTAAAPAVPERLVRLEAELALRERELDHWHSRVSQTLAEWGVDAPAPTLAARLDQLAAARRQWQQRRVDGRRWKRRARRLRGRCRRHRARLSRLAAQRRRLLLAAGVTTSAEFRERAARWSEAAKRAESRQQLRRQFQTACAGVAAPEVIEQRLAEHPPGEIERRCLELREQLERAQRELGELRAERSRLGDAAHGAADHEATRLELAVVAQRLRQALDRWRTAALAESALAAQLRRYEQEHQPFALQQASRYLERMTGGRYARVWTPLDRNELCLDLAEGRTLPIAALSRGTREQLYLALRMAIVDDYARRGVELPLVLDDVLVNFDDPRARRAAEALVDFASAGRQVFVLTCHEHIARAFAAAGAPVRDLGSGGAAWPEDVAARDELPPPLPEIAHPAPPALEPQREAAARPLVTQRRIRRPVLHRRDVLPEAESLGQSADAPTTAVSFARRAPRFWRPWAAVNSAEDFLGEFDERVFS